MREGTHSFEMGWRTRSTKKAMMKACMRRVHTEAAKEIITQPGESFVRAWPCSPYEMNSSIAKESVRANVCSSEQLALGGTNTNGT